MAFDQSLVDRLRPILERRVEVAERRMFGGAAFMVAGHMCCGVLGPDLIARVGAEAYADALALPHAREMDFTGRAMKGFVVVAAEGIASEGDLETWVERCLLFVNSLEPK